MIQVAAVIAVLGIVERFCQVGLVKRLMENWSHGTHNTIDDWVVDALTDSDPTLIAPKLEAAQATYDRMEPDEKAEATAPVPLPDEIVDVLLTRDEVVIAASNAGKLEKPC